MLQTRYRSFYSFLIFTYFIFINPQLFNNPHCSLNLLPLQMQKFVEIAEKMNMNSFLWNFREEVIHSLQQKKRQIIIFLSSWEKTIIKYEDDVLLFWDMLLFYSLALLKFKSFINFELEIELINFLIFIQSRYVTKSVYITKSYLTILTLLVCFSSKSLAYIWFQMDYI